MLHNKNFNPRPPKVPMIPLSMTIEDKKVIFDELNKMKKKINELEDKIIELESKKKKVSALPSVNSDLDDFHTHMQALKSPEFELIN
jgi:hypothetical protein